MRKFHGVLLCLLSTMLACAQSPKDALDAFRDSVKTSQLVLRNFSGEDEVHATWSGTEFELAAPRWRTMGILKVDSAELKGRELRLECIRQVALVNQTNQLELFAAPEKVEIRVKLGSSDPAETLPKLKDAHFYGSIKDALAGIPKAWQPGIPVRLAPKPITPTDQSKPACDCAADDRAKCAEEHRQIGGITPPVVVKQRDADMPPGLNTPRNAALGISLMVDTAGRPRDLWVTRSGGWGFDEQAAKSVLAYEFRPSTCHGKPQAVYLNVDVAFRTGP